MKGALTHTWYGDGVSLSVVAAIQLYVMENAEERTLAAFHFIPLCFYKHYVNETCTDFSQCMPKHLKCMEP